MSEEGLVQVGHSTDRRPDAPQRTVMLATVDPLMVPRATEVLSGQRADDLLDLLTMARVRSCLKQPGVLSVSKSTTHTTPQHADLFAFQPGYVHEASS